MPEWAEGSVAAELAIAAVLGAWTEKSEADRSVVENVSGKAYGEWIVKMREVALRPGTPLIQRDTNWKFLARYEGWYALGPRLFDEHLDRLQTAATSVLQEKDPQFDLPIKVTICFEHPRQGPRTFTPFAKRSCGIAGAYSEVIPKR